MELLQCLLPNPNSLRLLSYEVDIQGQQLTLNISSTQVVGQCPVCGGLSERVHSRYQRTLADLPCIHFSLSLLLQVCKFFCPNLDCRRRIFTERLPKVASPWARKTLRLVEHFHGFGLALGGAAGSRLARRLGYASCGTTLLNHLQCLPLPEVEVPKTLGVDDFAFRKGHNYGTILVNLETHKPIGLLADRKADTLTEWLTEHPGVEVLSRDRSKTYKSAMDKAAPNAMQVADRFHLVKNLSEALEVALGSFQTELKANECKALTEVAETVVVLAQPTATISAQERTQANHQQRVQQQREIKALYAQRWPVSAIAEKVGVSPRTILRYRKQPDFPETPHRRPTFGRSLLDSYKPEVVARWNDGITDSEVLMALLQQQGYQGSLRTLQRYLRSIRDAQAQSRLPVAFQGDQPLPKITDPQSPPLTPRQAAYLIVQRPENRSLEDKELIEHLVKQHPNLAILVELSDEFLQLLRQRQADEFDGWLMKALSCALQPVKRFATSLMDDYAAVKASIMTEVSNGPVEGLNNRLKMLKRQMYGRAGLELLTKRFILAV